MRHRAHASQEAIPTVNRILLTVDGRACDAVENDMGPRSWSFLVVIALLIAGCNGSSPTEPDLLAGLNGTWEGELAAYPAGEDWSRVRLSTESIGTSVQ